MDVALYQVNILYIIIIVFQPKKVPAPLTDSVSRLTYGHFYIDIRYIDKTIFSTYINNM